MHKPMEETRYGSGVLWERHEGSSISMKRFTVTVVGTIVFVFMVALASWAKEPPPSGAILSGKIGCAPEQVRVDADVTPQDAGPNVQNWVVYCGKKKFFCTRRYTLSDVPELYCAPAASAK